MTARSIRLASVASSAMTGVFVESDGATDHVVAFTAVPGAILADALVGAEVVDGQTSGRKFN